MKFALTVWKFFNDNPAINFVYWNEKQMYFYCIICIVYTNIVF